MKWLKRHLLALPVLGLFVLIALVPAGVQGKEDATEFFAQLQGFQVVPSVVTLAHGQLRMHIVAGPAIQYELRYQDLSSSSQLRAHLHLAQPGVDNPDGRIVWLCLFGGAGGIPDCPSSASAVVTGEITGVMIQAQGNQPQLGNQGLPSTDTPGVLFDKLVRALRAGVVYTDVHNEPPFPHSEIRGQVKSSPNTSGN